MHFLAIKVVFSCLGHNGNFVSSSNAREILCLVSKILCVARGVRSVWWQRPRTQTSSGHGDTTSARRVKKGTKQKQTDKNKLKWNKWCLRKVKFPQIIKLLANSSCNLEYNFHGFLQRFFFAFSAAVNHLRGPLRKQNFTNTGSKGHDFWSVIGGFRSVFCVFVVVYHLPQIPGNSGWDVTFFSGSSHWKFRDKRKFWKGGPVFPIGTFRMEIRLPFTRFLSFVLVSCYN